MADTNDTIDGLLAEFRGYSAGMPASYHVTMSWADFRRMLDRIEAAWKRETVEVSTRAAAFAINKTNEEWRQKRGDAAKLREALAPFPSLCDWLVVNAAKLGIPDMVAKLRERGDKARAALDAPPRNCDVGSAEEQEERLHAYCKSHRCLYCSSGNGDECKFYRPGMETDCKIEWANAPYEEGGAK